ncbi:MAG: hypothetical protein HXS54_12230, partial [Theionarchaea archaeon]|nr:hypothetical protein [Theionarchaea archaeon]
PEYEVYTLPNRGIIQLYCREDSHYIVNAHVQEEYFEDLKEECEEIIDALKIWPSLSFEGIVTGTLKNRKRLARAILRLFQLGVLENDSYDSVRESIIISGMSAAYDLTHSPENVNDDIIYRNILSRRIRVDKGKWGLIERPSENDLVHLNKVRQLFARYGVITSNLLKVNKEGITPHEFIQVCRTLLLRGEIREGQFIEGIEGIQYAIPDAVAFLRAMDEDDAIVVLTMKDPANLYGKLFPVTDAHGNVIKHAVTVAKHVVIQRGTVTAVVTSKNYPGRYFNIEMNILYDFPKETLVDMLEKVIEYGKCSAVQKRFRAVRFVSFNEEDVTNSNVGKILEAFGFSNEKNGLVLPIRRALKDFDVNTLDIPDVFEGFISEPTPEIVAVQEGS